MNMGCMGTIASIDMIESALYRNALATLDLGVTDGALSGKEVLDMMTMSSLTTPIGRVAYDVNRVNSNAQGLLLQVILNQLIFTMHTHIHSFYQSSSPLHYLTPLPQQIPGTVVAQIIAPRGFADATLIYPIPTWDERIYRWSLTKSVYLTPAIAIAAVSFTAWLQ